MKIFLPLLCLAISAHAAPFALNSIERWTGAGNQRAALVVDWHDGTRPHALAWGFRFNNSVTALDLWNAVTSADTGLSGNPSAGPIQYLRPARTGDVVSRGTYSITLKDDRLPATGQHPAARKTAYACDHLNTADGVWILWRGNASTFATTHFTRVTTPLSATPLANNDWFALTFCADGDDPKPPSHPAAALHYPFGTDVIYYNQGGTVIGDWIDRELFNIPQTALGRPTVDTTGDGTIEITSTVPVVSVYPAFRATEIVSLGVKGGGELILAFDHRVYDNPDNPYGVDFIIFGNAFQVIGSGRYWYNGDPNLTGNGGSCFTEDGHVEISQDGVNWHRVSVRDPVDANFDRTADSFAPTLGRVYDTNHVDTALGAGNQWWGGPTDPTIPVDPTIAPPDLRGFSVADTARRYRGSAGGTAFDIGELPLARDPDTNMKWIQYVRVIVTSDMYMAPEVDAIADVSPALPVDLWRNQNFAWLEDPDLEDDLSDPDRDTIPNLMEYALGREPRTAESPALFTMDHYRADDDLDVLGFTFTVNPDAHDVRAEIIRTSDLLAPSSEWTSADTRHISDTPLNATQSLRLIEAPITGQQGFMRLRTDYE